MSTTNERSQNDIVVGDGTVTVIPFQFNYFNDNNIDILVLEQDTTVTPHVVSTLVEGTDYTKYDDRIELTNPLAVGFNLLVKRVVIDIQPLDYDDLRPFPESVHEKQEDRTFMSLSEIKNMFKQTVFVADDFFTEGPVRLASPQDNMYLRMTLDPVTNEWVITYDISTIDLSDYYTRSEVDHLQSDQDTALQNYADQAVIDMGDLKVDKGGIVAGTGINVSGTGSVADPLVVESSGGLSAPTGEVLFGTGTGVGSSPDLKVTVGGGAALIEGVDEIELTAGTLLGFDAPNISMRSNRVQDVAAPVGPLDAVNKQYADSVLDVLFGIPMPLDSVLSNRLVAEAAAAAEANTWGSIAYGDGVLVAVSQGGTNRVMRSTDLGLTWTAVAAAEANTWFAITYGDGVFVAVSQGGTNRVMRSTNGGLTWAAVAAAEANAWRSITYGDGVFVAVSQDGTNRVMRSTNGGLTWTAVAAAEANAWQSIAYGDGVFVAVAQDGTNQVMRLFSKIVWTPISDL